MDAIVAVEHEARFSPACRHLFQRHEATIGLAQALVANRGWSFSMNRRPILILRARHRSRYHPSIRTRGGTVLLSSHQLDQIESVCTRIVFLNRGCLVAAGTIDELVERRPCDTLVVESLPEADQADLRMWLASRGACLRTVRTARRGGWNVRTLQPRAAARRMKRCPHEPGPFVCPPRDSDRSQHR